MTGQLAILEFPSEGFGRPEVNALVTAADGSVSGALPDIRI
ncbi:MAG: hypothetical protein ACLR8U_14250 [Oscillospiraceae bacterium]